MYASLREHGKPERRGTGCRQVLQGIGSLGILHLDPSTLRLPTLSFVDSSESIHSAFLHYNELAKTYGPVFTMRYGSKYVCVITGHQVRTCPETLLSAILKAAQAATDIMVKQSHKLVDRPKYIAAGEILSKGMRILITGVGPRLRRMRT